jgi:RHS repeat-associated protein
LRVIWSIFIWLLASLPSPVSGKPSSCFVPLSPTSSATGKIFIPPAAENYTYDFDGNLLSDGRWTYAWDAENQLIAMQTLPGAPSGSARRLEFQYDDLGRRIQKRSYIGTTNVLTSSTKFLYDGFNLLAELNDTGNSLIRSYIWGSDIAGAVRGTGGVGGLVAVTDSAQGTHFAVSDGQGNVVGLVKATDGTRTATYEYDPFGQNIRKTGSASDLNPFRYSSRFTDNETDLLYYGFRLYNPNTGRWLSRDPIAELGGANLYAFVHNSPIQNLDLFGLDPEDTDLEGMTAAGSYVQDDETRDQMERINCEGFEAIKNGAKKVAKEAATQLALLILTEGVGNFARLGAEALTEGRALARAAEEAGVLAKTGETAAHRTAVQVEFPFARGASVQTPGVTTAGEKFVRVGAEPRNLKFGSTSLSGTQPGTYAFPEQAFNAIGESPAALKNLGDLPGPPPQYYRILEPPPGTPIQRGVVPGGQFGGVGGVPEVIFPQGF